MKRNKGLIAALVLSFAGTVALSLTLFFAYPGAAAADGFHRGSAECRLPESSGQPGFRGSPGRSARYHGGQPGGTFLLLAAGLGIWFFYRRGKDRRGAESDPLSVLAELYVSGAIPREEFLARKAVLEEEIQ